MNVVFRVDSSSQIGSGHLMRCITLAQNLRKEKQAKVYFVMRNLEGNLINIVKEQEFDSYILDGVEDENTKLEGYGRWLTVTQEYDAQDTINAISKLKQIDLLVVDSYAIDNVWERKMRPFVKKIMVIDDLANRKHDCDVLLDQNFYKNKDSRYKGLVPENCELFLGPQYAILREEFYEARKHLKKRDGNIKNILVFYGGVDLTNETQKTLDAIVMLDRNDITVNVIVGQNNPHKKSIEDFCSKYAYMNYHCQVNNIAEFMNDADLAIGAGGTTTWERCFLGLPSIVIAVADNQVVGCSDMSTLGSILYLGYWENVTHDDIKKVLVDFSKEGYINLMECMGGMFKGKDIDYVIRNI